MDKDNGPLVPWDTLGQERFDELVEALVPYQHPEGSRVDAIDGRGGDGGVDVAVIEPDPDTGNVVRYRDEHGHLIVYQLKYFPEGFSGPYNHRRRQIKRSLKQAIKNNPEMHEWVLIAPCRQTQGDRNFLEKLREDYPDLTITLVDRTRLNGESWVAGHQDVARSLFPRDELLKKAAILNHEKTVLAGGLPDLAERQRALNEVTDDLDPDWTWRVWSAPSGPETHMLIPKHPQAAEASPISFTMNVKDSSEGSAFRRALRYGALEPIVVPGEVVSSFKFTGPPIVRSANRDDSQILRVELHQMQTTRDPVPLALNLYDQQGNLMRTVQGRATNFDTGTHGSTFRHEFYDGGFVIEWQLPFSAQESPDAGGKMMFEVGQNRSCSAVRGVTDLALTLGASVSARLTTPNGHVLAHVSSPAPGYDDSQRQHLMILREVADDLTYLEREFHREFAFPAAVTALQRVDLRVLRLLLEGHAVCGPYAQRLHLDVKPGMLNDPSFRGLLETPHQILSVHDEDMPVPWIIDAIQEQGDIAKVEIREPMGLYFPEMVAENANEVRDALSRGEGTRLNLHSPSGLRPRSYLPGRMHPTATIELHPWGLTGIDEVPELRESSATEPPA